MVVSFAVVKGSYNQATVLYLLVPDMSIVGLVEKTIAFVL